MQETSHTDDLEVLLNVLPTHVAQKLRESGRLNELIEVVMDLGRAPEIRFADNNGISHEQIVSGDEVTRDDIAFVVNRIGEFDSDNRAGITRTLHRISGIKNRRGDVVGLTCRVGRAVYGTLEIIKDIIESGKGILLLGRPGVGKTTMLREAARVLADTKRVVIVDTSNEIGGDGDIPHSAVGRARRMQVATPSLQHEVMIEAVENHNPQVIVIDEIGREAEAEAARTIAERGVQLIGTAHGQTLENLLQNPTLNDLVGGIESVTLIDEEARRRRTQKTVLERRTPPTFDVLVEIQDRHRLLVHHNVAEAVDNLLRGRMPPAELRSIAEDGSVKTEKVKQTMGDVYPPLPDSRKRISEPKESHDDPSARELSRQIESKPIDLAPKTSFGVARTMQLFAYGIPRNRLQQAVRHLSVPADIVDNADDADVVITTKAYYRQRTRAITDAEHRNIPIYVLRSNSALQMENFLIDLFNLNSANATPLDAAMSETEEAIKQVLAGERSIDLTPQNQFVRRKQHEMARDANLISHSYGKEPYRRVRIFRD